MWTASAPFNTDDTHKKKLDKGAGEEKEEEEEEEERRRRERKSLSFST